MSQAASLNMSHGPAVVSWVVVVGDGVGVVVVMGGAEFVLVDILVIVD